MAPRFMKCARRFCGFNGTKYRPINIAILSVIVEHANQPSSTWKHNRMISKTIDCITALRVLPPTRLPKNISVELKELGDIFGMMRTTPVNFATLSKRKHCSFLTCSRLDQALPYSKQYKRYISWRFHAFQRRHTKSANIMWLKGEKRRRFVLTTLLYTLFNTEDPENDALTGGTSLYRKLGNIWAYGLTQPPPPPPTPRVQRLQ